MPVGTGAAERGSTFVVMLVLLFASLSLTVSALVGARSGLTISENYETGLQALLAAEAGAVHAQTAIERFGVVQFDADIVDRWDTVFGASPRTFPGKTSVRYSVSVQDDPVNPSRFMILTSSGQAPNESQKSVRVRMRKNTAFSPGAIYLPNSDVLTNFNGNNFLVDGNDRKLNGDPGEEGALPGIATVTEESADSVRDSLSMGQNDNVIGVGNNPSVYMSSGPSVYRLDNEIVPAILSRPDVVTNPVLSGNDTFGTLAAPQITYFSGSVTLGGTVTGAGILIVEQGLTISGDADFTGLIIVRGATSITSITGNATIVGAVWTTDLTLSMSGSASVTYSSEAVELANGVDASNNLLPERLRVVGWSEF
ncbi:MAG: hypothetical protein ACREQ9_08310 [Candidatus Binatia bacterium]